MSAEGESEPFTFAAATIEENGARRAAAIRVMYEVLGGELPCGLRGELRVSLAQSDEAGDPEQQQHYAPGRSVEAERVGGSVLVVLSHHHGSRPAHASGTGAAGGSGVCPLSPLLKRRNGTALCRSVSLFTCKRAR